jgi:hypothetical protein
MNAKLFFLAKLFIYHGFNGRDDLIQKYEQFRSKKCIIISKKGRNKVYTVRIDFEERIQYDMRNITVGYFTRDPEYSYAFIYYA